MEENEEKFKEDGNLVEINPEIIKNHKITWKEYALIETDPRAS